jgi:leader peptidase (prepilin peptidase)/N-methyltransferase
MMVLVLVGLALGMLLNHIVARQTGESWVSERSWGWLPLLGPVVQRRWMALAVEIATTMMTVVLWQQYGWSVRFVLLLAASLVLIDTAAVDWKVRLIDTLVMLGATLGALLCAPLLVASWANALLGLIVAAIIFVLLFMLARIIYPQQHAPFGLGDVYLAMFIGALLGLGQVGSALLYGVLLAGAASLLLLLVHGYQRARHMPIAYGSFLCLGALLHLTLWPL